ncbi:UNVERIFIED_ORG: hypothetical protein M2312_005271, partial [Rhizobium esperanzae]|nr:hypothetical protein [Rhizobium esperanzae]
LVPIQCLQRIAHHQGESFAIITVKAKLAPMGLRPTMDDAGNAGQKPRKGKAAITTLM